MKLDPRQLTHLQAVIENGGFGRASEAIHLTQPALTRSIQALERSVGAKVINRQRGGLVLTEVGELLLEHACRLNKAERELQRHISMIQGLEMGELRIGVGMFAAAGLIGPAIGLLNQHHPNIKVRVTVAPYHEMPERVLNGDLDIIVMEKSLLTDRDQFEIETLSPHPMAMVCRDGHPLQSRKKVGLREMLSFPLAAPKMPPALAENFKHNLLKTVPDLAEQARDLATIECDSWRILLDVILHSDAVAMFPIFAIEQELRSGRLHSLPPFDIGIDFRLALAYRGRRDLTSSEARFIELLHQHDKQIFATIRQLMSDSA
ncbi:LysR family transcriptional regulator [Solimicrobium silvestre]|uniref:Transcriptional regulator n=1 Tax=Solimicrobium silvestre TaxID=2099400 RepID=A0A2S9H5A0_9BURK|nr:LysR family transcriptional regulator [Solimicrobium silvestre]PRC95165.1 Transcriptional regulator [Solimicrobium silvestre]